MKARAEAAAIDVDPQPDRIHQHAEKEPQEQDYQAQSTAPVHRQGTPGEQLKQDDGPGGRNDQSIIDQAEIADPVGKRRDILELEDASQHEHQRKANSHHMVNHQQSIFQAHPDKLTRGLTRDKYRRRLIHV